MKPTLALSTCWNSYRHTDGYAMLTEIREMGFEYAELSHGTRIVLVPGVLRAVEEGVIKISSTHNFCPLPMGVNHSAPNLFEPSVRTGKEQDQWLRHTLRSIDFTAQVGASVMVTHLGSVHFFWSNPVRKVKAYRQANPDLDPATDEGYRRVLAKACAKLRTRMPPYWEQVLASLEQIKERCREKKVMIGCENREKFQELPLDDDFPQFFGGLPEDTHCGYWHDTGHAELKQSMGLIQHREHLAKNASRLMGFHLHDVADEDDHQPVGYGQIDFEMVSSFWQPHHLLTLELSPRTTPHHVEESRDRVRAMIEQRFG